MSSILRLITEGNWLMIICRNKGAYFHKLAYKFMSSILRLITEGNWLMIICRNKGAYFHKLASSYHQSERVELPDSHNIVTAPGQSPLMLQNLTEGVHWLRVTAYGCHEEKRQMFFFDVPSSSPEPSTIIEQ